MMMDDDEYYHYFAVIHFILFGQLRRCTHYIITHVPMDKRIQRTFLFENPYILYLMHHIVASHHVFLLTNHVYNPRSVCGTNLSMN